MKKDSRTRLFEVMGRLDKTFKQKLNEDFEQPNPVAFKQPEEEVEELSTEEKYKILKNKIDDLYSIVHGETSEENPDEESLETSGEESSETSGEESSETSGEEEDEHETPEIKESKPKIPIANIAKVGN